MSEYLVSPSDDRDKALALSRVIDIYKNVYSEYSEDFRKIVGGDLATAEEIIQCFEFLSAHIDNPKILNTEIKLVDLLTERGHVYLKSRKYRDILNAIMGRLSEI